MSLLEGLFEGLFNAAMSFSERAERQVNQQVKRDFREAAIKYDDDDKESVEAYNRARERVGEFQQKKAELDSKKAEVQYKHDYDKAVREGNIHGQEMAAYKYKQTVDKAEREQRDIERMKQNSDMSIQKQREFFHEILPRMVADIKSAESTARETFRVKEDADDFKQTTDKGARSNRDMDYSDKVKKQEEIINKVQNGEIELTSNQAKGNFGEMLVDSDLRKKGFVRISQHTVTDLKDKTHQGVDGIYFNPNARPSYIILEAKYNTSPLSALKSGVKETSETWLFDLTDEKMKEDRVKQSIGDKDGEYSRDLAMEIFESLLTEDGASIVVTARIADDNKSITYTEMDTNGDFVEEVEFEKKM